jgi:hypothetical protein
MSKYNVSDFAPSIVERASRADAHDPVALDALVLSLGGKVKRARLGSPAEGIGGSPDATFKTPKSGKEQGVGGTFSAEEDELDLDSLEGLRAAFRKGDISAKSYQKRLGEIARKAGINSDGLEVPGLEAALEALDDGSDDGDDNSQYLDEDSDDGSDDGAPGGRRESAPGPSVPARKLADARHFDRQVVKTMRSIGGRTDTLAARNSRFNALISAGYSPAIAQKVLT